MIVVDANIVVLALLRGGWPPALAADRLIAPTVLWSEVQSTLHEAMWRGELERDLAAVLHAELAETPVTALAPAELGAEAWRIADELGVAKTYDAEYLALARLSGCRLVTNDARLRRGAHRLGFVIGLAEM